MMGWAVRLFEKLTGTPHQRANAERVAAAADDLTASIRELSATLKPYNDCNDPLVAFMKDVIKRRRGSRNDRSSLRS